MFMVNRPYEAMQLRLLNPESATAIVPWSQVTRASDQVVTRLVVNSQVFRDYTIIQQMKANVEGMLARETGKTLVRKTALSRAYCRVKGINVANDFHNLPFDLKTAERAGVVERMGEFTTTSQPIRIVDTERYIAILKSYYPDEQMDELTETLITEYINKHHGYLQSFEGMPGAHAEVLAVDDVFKKLREKVNNVDNYLGEIEVYTIKIQYPDSKDFLSNFKACKNCDGILRHPIQIHTGRIE